MSWIPPRGTRLSLTSRHEVKREPVGPLLPYLRAFLGGEGEGGMVLLGAYGSGKTSLSAALAGPGVVVVPLRLLARGGRLEARWEAMVGDPEAVARGELRVVLDGLDEVARPGEGSFQGLFEAITALAGPRWLMTARTGTFRTEGREAGAHQVDSLGLPGVETVEIDPLAPEEVEQALGWSAIPEAATSPILLRLCLEAPDATRGAPDPAGVVAAYLAALGCDLDRLEAAAWLAYDDRGLSEESASFPPDADRGLLRGQPVERMMVRDADGRWRFGHRSLYDFLVARRLGPWIAASQGGGPGLATGRHVSEAMRVFLAGLVRQPPRGGDERWVEVPRGDWVSGGDHGPDERPLVVRHLERPFLLARRPATEGEIAAWLAHTGPRPPGYWFLRHWRDGAPAPGTEAAPSFHLRPEDADAYAAWAGARLPSWMEWEKGVRGISGRRWPWGDRPEPGRANTSEAGRYRPLAPAGPQGPTGVWAAAGDVFEITASYYRDRVDRGRVVMGGSFAHTVDVARAGLRLSHTLSGHLKLGLRLARDG